MQADSNQFMVLTTSSRILQREAENYRDLISDLHFDGHTPKQIWTMAEYQAEIVDREEQHRLYHELVKAIEEERKSA